MSPGISPLCRRRFGRQTMNVPMDSPVFRRSVFYLLFVLFLNPFILTVGDLVFIAIETSFEIGSEGLSFMLPMFRKEIYKKIKG